MIQTHPHKPESSISKSDGLQIKTLKQIMIKIISSGFFYFTKKRLSAKPESHITTESEILFI